MHLICSQERGRPVHLIDTEAGTSQALKLRLNQSYAFDHGLARQGYALVKVGYQQVALPRHAASDLVRFPKAFVVQPSALPDHVVQTRYRVQIEPDYGSKVTTVDLIGSDGQVVRTMDPEMLYGLAGELSNGTVVGFQGLWSWDAEHVLTLDRPSRCIGVVGGQYIVVEGEDYISLCDAELRPLDQVSRPERWDLDGHPTEDADRLAFRLRCGVLMASEHQLQVVRLPDVCHALAWTLDGLLAQTDPDLYLIDPDSGTFERFGTLPEKFHLRLDVTGFNNLEDLPAYGPPEPLKL